MTSVPSEMSRGLFDLTRRVALVRGAGTGLGWKAALALTKAGADLALTSRTRVDLEYVGKLVAAIGRKLITIATGTSDSAAREDIGVTTAGAAERS